MRWFGDEYDEAYDELVYEKEKDEEEEENDETAMYFDVPLPYRNPTTERRK